jgi:hypothetical protein
MGGPHSSVGRERGGVLLWGFALLGRGPDLRLGQIRSRGLLLPFLFLSFSFSVFKFFGNFCKKAPNPFKPNSIFFIKSRQCFQIAKE